MRIHVQRLRVPLLGVIHVAGTGHGLLAVDLQDDGDALREALAARHPGSEIRGGSAITAAAGRAIRRYLTGGPDPDVAVVARGNPFEERVWREIRRIPQGKVRAYGWIARAARRPQAARAVGQACGRNPVPLVVPCHRVVAADGSLGGYSAGLDLKRRLLRLEGAPLKGL